MMLVGVIVCDIWALALFCDLWPSAVTFIVCQGHFHFNHQMDVRLLYIGTKYEVCMFNRIWDMDNCFVENLINVTMTLSPIWFLWISNINVPRAYLSNTPNFILIKHKRNVIQSRKVNLKLWKQQWILRHCDLDIWPKVTNFDRDWASAVSNHLAITASKSIHPFSWNFVHKKPSFTLTNTQTNWSEKVTPPQCVRCKDKFYVFFFFFFWQGHI